MKRKKPVFQIKEDFLKGGLSRFCISQTINRFKKELDYDELLVALPEIMKIAPRFKRLIWGNLFPKSYTELGVGNNYYYRSEGVTYELNWILLQIAKHKAQIKAFVVARDSINNYLALGDYDRVTYEIRKLEEVIGISVWSTEIRLMTYSLSGKEQQSFELLSKINQAADDVTEKGKTGYVPLLAHFLYKRSSCQSASSYEEELAAINKRSRNDFQIDRLKYYQFRLNYFAAEDHSKVESLLVYETANALVDKYMSMLNLLKWLFAGTQDERITALAFACKLYGYVGDSSLIPYLVYSASDKIPDSYYSDDFLEVLNSYYKMDYHNTVNLCKRYIINNPNHFDCIRIYVQSLIFLNNSYIPIVSDASSAVNQVSLLVFKSLYESDNTASLADLYDFNKTIYGLPIAAGIHGFIMEQRKNKVDSCYKYLSLNTFDPLFSKIWKNGERDKSIAYLTRAKEHGVKSITVDYYLSLFGNFEETCPQGIAPYIYERDKALKDFFDTAYEQCISDCEDLYCHWGQYLSIGQFTSDYTFRSFVERGLKMQAISFYVDRFITKRALVNSVQTEDFVEKLRKERYKKDIRNTIDLQIFVLLNASEDEQKAHVLQLFMNYLDASNMSELIGAIKDDIRQEKQEVFLFSLLEGDILRHLPYIGSTKQMLEEQQLIVQYLSQLESPHHKLYEDYNQQIIQLMISYENIKKLDESRIYVNEAAIIKYELGECENLYRQLACRNEVAKSVTNVYILQTTDDGIQDGVDVKLMQAGFRATRNVTTDITTQIFNLICQKYLYSKFGLKTYLSTRIRHGVLEGEIRSVFDSLHLMLTTQNNRFTPITYWRNIYGLSTDEHESLMLILGSFSSSLGQIIDDFKSEVLQIKIKDGDPGMFDFILPDEKKSYAIIMAQSKTDDYDEFCSQVLLLLDRITEQSLVRIREYIHNELQKKFIRLIDKLENDAQYLSTCHFYDSLLEAIAQSRENIQGALVKIEKWFALQTGVYDDFVLKDQIELVWRVTERQYPNVKFHLDKRINDTDFIVDASHYLDIADMLTILFNNMFSHSIVKNPRDYHISANRDGEFVLLHFENQTCEDDDLLNATFAELLKLDNRLQLEGRSGLAKVKKIIIFDLQGKEEDFSIIAEQGICKVDVRLRLNSLLKKEIH